MTAANMSEMRLSLQLGHLETLRHYAPAHAQAGLTERLEAVADKIAANRRAVALQGDTGLHGRPTDVRGELAKLSRRLDTRAPRFEVGCMESVA
jgi:hypothetical protein